MQDVGGARLEGVWGCALSNDCAAGAVDQGVSGCGALIGLLEAGDTPAGVMDANRLQLNHPQTSAVQQRTKGRGR